MAYSKIHQHISRAMKKTQPRLNVPPRRYRAASGFTLIEIMVVLFILLALAAVAVGAYRGQMEASKIKTTQVYISTLASAIERYEINVGRMPSSLDDLLVCPDGLSETKWAGPYLKDNAQTEDAWRNPYQYVTPGNHSRSGFDVWSFGPDGRDGTDDDIGNWKKIEQ